MRTPVTVIACVLALIAPPAPAANGVGRDATAYVNALAGVGDARELVVVSGATWSSTTAVVRTYVKRGNRWYTALPAYRAYVGRRGFGQPKREGDAKTPVGAFTLARAFGTLPAPRLRIPYERVTSRDVWVDDPSSPYYNTHQTGRLVSPSVAIVHGRRTSVEPMRQPRAYGVAIEIGYNLERTPGAGSAIFLHMSLGHATSGCVALPRAQLLTLARWLGSSYRPRIIMGPAGTLAS